MYVDLNQIFPFIVIIPWFGISAVLFFHFRAKQREYLQHFVSEGISLDVRPGSAEHFKVRQAINYVMWHRQTNPDLEHLRRGMLRSYGFAAVWFLGGPLVLYATSVLLSVSRLVHYR